MPVLADNALSIFTDGSSRNGPRRGGSSWRFVWTGEDGHERTDEGRTESWPGATVNEMELQAVIDALTLATGRRPPVDLTPSAKIIVYTDSEYVASNYPRAVFQWSKNGWHLRDGGVPENLKQWQQLVSLARRLDRMHLRLLIEQIPRRSSDHARRVDNLAKQASKSPAYMRSTLRPRHVTRKVSPNQVDPGCVPMEAQIERIRIVEHRSSGGLTADGGTSTRS